MDYPFIIQQLAAHKPVFENLLEGLSAEQYLFREKENKWCLLEVLCHLHDEEIEDFRMRVKTTLESPGSHPPPIDPVGWVQSRNYISQDYDQKLKDFLQERQQSIEWLNSLKNPAWENAYDHPKLGLLSAHLFLNNWLAHDFLHIRQIVRIKRNYLKFISEENLNYAGNW